MGEGSFPQPFDGRGQIAVPQFDELRDASTQQRMAKQHQE